MSTAADERESVPASDVTLRLDAPRSTTRILERYGAERFVIAHPASRIAQARGANKKKETI